MTHSYSKLLFHLIWSTKKRQPFIATDIAPRLYSYLRQIINNKQQHLYVINGMPDHIHMLVSLSPTIRVSDFIKEIKVSSTKWLRTNPICLTNFCWQEGFSAYTVGYSTMQAVIKYIENQQSHHEHTSYEEEYLLLLKMQNINFDERFVLG